MRPWPGRLSSKAPTLLLWGPVLRLPQIWLRCQARFRSSVTPGCMAWACPWRLLASRAGVPSGPAGRSGGQTPRPASGRAAAVPAAVAAQRAMPLLSPAVQPLWPGSASTSWRRPSRQVLMPGRRSRSSPRCCWRQRSSGSSGGSSSARLSPGAAPAPSSPPTTWRRSLPATTGRRAHDRLQGRELKLQEQEKRPMIALQRQQTQLLCRPPRAQRCLPCAAHHLPRHCQGAARGPGRTWWRPTARAGAPSWVQSDAGCPSPTAARRPARTPAAGGSRLASPGPPARCRSGRAALAALRGQCRSASRSRRTAQLHGGRSRSPRSVCGRSRLPTPAALPCCWVAHRR
mmetsp:Transcript_102373/g.305729  ORF Transcript_102373/g.305729 Transcript_102373/m.305729 type:complete len:345 (+) Transcript_102373:698-1732(+)